MTPEQARLGALTRFAIAITALNVLGQTVLGFEVSVLQTVLCVVTAYIVETVLEIAGAWSEDRPAKFLGGGLKQIVIFLLPAHITGLAIGMLIYAGDRLLPYVFAAATAIASKAVFTITVDGRRRHYLNPSNLGVAATLFLFPTVALAAPYQFTEYLHGIWDWALPALFVCTGTFINARFTGKIPLIIAWVSGFLLQAIIRHLLYPTSLLTTLAPLTGVPLLLFTFYMITDPQTSPSSTRGQIIFGTSIAAAYAVLMMLHVMWTIFVALLAVCIGRALVLYACELAFVRKAQVLVERLWFTLFGRAAPLTSVPAGKADLMK
jgi:hypothetical protein